MAGTGETPKPSSGAPVVLDMGKQRRKQIKDLRRGKGKLMDEISGAIQELRVAGTVSAGAQPVIVVLQQKRRRRSGLVPMNMF
jgi:Family of unknown function (DUF6200)